MGTTSAANTVSRHRTSAEPPFACRASRSSNPSRVPTISELDVRHGQRGRAAAHSASRSHRAAPACAAPRSTVVQQRHAAARRLVNASGTGVTGSGTPVDASILHRIPPRRVRSLFHHRHPGRNHEARQRHVRRLGAHRDHVQRVPDAAARQQRTGLPFLQHGVRRRKSSHFYTPFPAECTTRDGQPELAVRRRRCSTSRCRRPTDRAQPDRSRLPPLQQRPGRSAQPPLHDRLERALADDGARMGAAKAYGSVGVIMCSPP